LEVSVIQAVAAVAQVLLVQMLLVLLHFQPVKQVTVVMVLCRPSLVCQ
jgi:hypothetical protein